MDHLLDQKPLIVVCLDKYEGNRKKVDGGENLLDIINSKEFFSNSKFKRKSCD